MALACLTQPWAWAEGGTATAFIVDHGLRSNSRAEAMATAATLQSRGITAHILTLTDLPAGPGISDRARHARYHALAQACRAAGMLHLLLGHHAADQAETVLMRHLRGSGDAGLAGMAAIAETSDLRLLRPLLGVSPGRLRATLRAHGIPWAEDPTNADRHYTRARLRHLRADAAGDGAATRALTEAAHRFGLRRAEEDGASARFLAAHAVIRPEGFVRIAQGGPWPPQALGQILRMVTGAAYPPDPATVRRIAADPARQIGHGLVLGGARLLPAGRQGPGFLLCREAAAMAAPIAAAPGIVWDRRFRVRSTPATQPAAVVGALGEEARHFRQLSDLPSAVLRTLPCFRDSAGQLLSVPALSWAAAGVDGSGALIFAPAMAAAGAAFSPGMQAMPHP